MKRLKWLGMVSLSCETRLRPSRAANGENVGIGQSPHSGCAGLLKVDHGFTSEQTRTNLRIEVFVSQEPGPHQRTGGLAILPASNLAHKRGFASRDALASSSNRVSPWRMYASIAARFAR